MKKPYNNKDEVIKLIIEDVHRHNSKPLIEVIGKYLDKIFTYIEYLEK